MSNRKHLTYMGLAAVVVLGALWVAGVPLDRAAPWAILLACPVMMIVMMLFMHDGMSHTGHRADERDEADLQRVDEQYRR